MPTNQPNTIPAMSIVMPSAETAGQNEFGGM